MILRGVKKNNVQIIVTTCMSKTSTIITIKHKINKMIDIKSKHHYISYGSVTSGYVNIFKGLFTLKVSVNAAMSLAMSLKKLFRFLNKPNKSFQNMTQTLTLTLQPYH